MRSAPILLLTLTLAGLVAPLAAAQPPSGFPPPGNGTFDGGFPGGGPRQDPVDAAVKIVHVLAAIAWVGAVLFLFFVLGPAIKQAQNGPPFLQALAKWSRIGLYMPIASIVTVASGAFLYWSMKDRLLSTATTSLLVFNLGVLCGLIAFAHGAWFQNRLLRSIRNAQNGTVAGLQELARRLHIHNAISTILLSAAAVAMAKGPI